MYIKVRVKAGARKEEVIKEKDDHFIISIKEPAERNQANRRIIEIIKGLFPGTIVRIINGHQSPSKLLAVDEKGE
jgi:uncharacterized protein (TIGR00251 family)